MTNLTPELEKPEDRRGVAPFEHGVIRKNFDGELHVNSETIPFGSSGNISLYLLRNKNPEEAYLVTDEAFTVDVNGNVNKGNPIKLTKEGYYDLWVEIQTHDDSLEKSKIKMKLWIDKTTPLFTSDLSVIYLDEPTGIADGWNLKGNEESQATVLMIKDDEQLLKALRVSVTGGANV